jgi:hypothetical protein
MDNGLPIHGLETLPSRHSIILKISDRSKIHYRKGDQSVFAKVGDRLYMGSFWGFWLRR